VHRKRTPEARGDAIVDILRLENRKIIEHRDVIQPVPETAETAANPNTMF
jgi:predicted SnoaL-like aldol condensation-catalyzing enzyme